MPRRKVESKMVTVVRDDVARVDMGLDPDGDVEFITLFRDGNRWAPIEMAPTVVPPGAVLAGLLKLEVLGFGPDEAVRACEFLEHQAMPAETPPEVARMFGLLRRAADLAMADLGWRRG